MNRRDFLKALGVGAGTLLGRRLGAMGGVSPMKRAQKPNILYIFTDDQSIRMLRETLAEASVPFRVLP